MAVADPLAHRTRVAAIAVLVVSVAALALQGPGRTEGPVRSAATVRTIVEAVPPPAAAAPEARSVLAPVPATSPRPVPVARSPDDVTTAEGPGSPLVVPDATTASSDTADVDAPAAPAPPTTPVEPARGDTARERFASRFPAHAAATQDPDDPASSRWAVLIGVNDHAGATRDNIGSRQDAQTAYGVLMAHGWQPDHVLLLTDDLATRETILQAIGWLARRTTSQSLAVFSYSGHVKQWHGVDADGDGEVTDEGLWPSDNAHITDREFADALGEVDAGRLWVNIMGCEAAGLLDPGLVRDGRIATFSSAEDEKSYEDPSVGHSVWGWNLFVRALAEGHADADDDGDVTVQEAATYAIPRAVQRTSGQWPYGAQHGGMIDRSGGTFSLTIPSR